MQIETLTKPRKKTALIARDPETVAPPRAKILVYGEPGIGKTFGALGFPACWYCDTEAGATLPAYKKLLSAGGGKYFGPEDGALDLDEIADQFAALSSEEHGFKTAVIDSITKPFNLAIMAESERLGREDTYGKSKKPAIKGLSRLMFMIGRVDMNVILIAHEKANYAVDANGVRGEVFPKAPDVYDKLTYDLNLVLHIVKDGVRGRRAVVRKSRLAAFEMGASLPFTFEEIQTRFDASLDMPATAVPLASPEEVSEIERLIRVLNVKEAEIDKLLVKAGAAELKDLSEVHAQKMISHYRKKTQPEGETEGTR